MLRRPIESTPYLSIRYTERLVEAGSEASVGSRGDAYDNALAESVIGPFKTFIATDRGAVWMMWNTRRWNGSRGSTPAVCWNRWAMFPQRSMRISSIDASQSLRLLGYSTD